MLNPLSNAEKFQRSLKLELLKSIFPPPSTDRIFTQGQRPVNQKLQNYEDLESKNQPDEGSGSRRILMTAEWPHSVHGVVSFYINDIHNWGTGILIGPNVVLTAGHNLYNFEEKTYVNHKRMQFFPGVNEQMLPFGPVDIQKYFVSPNYINEGKEDYGILILAKPIGEKTGYFGLSCLEPEELGSKKIHLTGYPQDKVASKPKTFEMWEKEEVVSQVHQERREIRYSIDADQGTSGGGVWYQEGEEYYVCAVHGAQNRPPGTATLVTRDLCDHIHNWVLEVSSENATRLQLRNFQIDTDCLSLLVQENLCKLSTLCFSAQKIGVEGARVLAQNTSWINLLELNLSENNIGAEGARALAQNSSWTKLSQLDLSQNNIGAEGARALAQNSSWTKLLQLNLNKNKIGAEGAKSLAKNISWVKLKQLDLGGNNIGDEGAKSLAQNASWINLLELNLDFNNIGDEGASSLAKNISWIKLLELNLGGNNIGSEGAKALAQKSRWTNLSRLSLIANKIDAEGAKALAQNSSWVNFSQLGLSRNNIGAEGAKALAENTSWVNLSELSLSRNNIGNEGAKALSQNSSWINLSRLNLGGNRIDAKGAKALAKNTSWVNLSHLGLDKNNIGVEGAKVLAQNASWIRLSKSSLRRNNMGDE